MPVLLRGNVSLVPNGGGGGHEDGRGGSPQRIPLAIHYLGAFMLKDTEGSPYVGECGIRPGFCTQVAGINGLHCVIILVGSADTRESDCIFNT